MKSAVWVTLIALCFMLLFPLIMKQAENVSAENPSLSENNLLSEPVLQEKSDEDSKEDTSVSPCRDCTETILVQDGDDVISMTMENYLIGVVAGEMPASFEQEALKAQAVAARTYTRYTMAFCPEKHENADICTNPGCCKAYLDDEALREKWGEQYREYRSKIASCVSQTDGITLVYEGEPILAVFHSSSAGYTEDSGEVWLTSLPYLQSVKSPETSEEVPDYVTTVKLSQEEFRSVFQTEYPKSDLSGDSGSWFSQPVFTESGRLQTIVIGGVTVTGVELRSLFSLRSAAITVTAENGEILFTVTGYGHGVGMSQYGANEMAKEGYSYEEILIWYYTGAVLSADA